MGINQVASDLYKSLTESDERKPKAGDVKATVIREEGNTVWVKFPGGEDETPVEKTNNATVGDEVMVRTADGRAWILGNNTSPATDDTKANEAKEKATGAYDMAVFATESAEVAKVASESAVKSATEAKEAADRAEGDAGRAYAAAERAEGDAAAANEAAERAESDAEAAHDESMRALKYANDSLAQLGVVEDVVGVLNWVSTHATYKQTEDTEVQEGKWYFVKSGNTYDVVTNPTGDPSQQGWYEIDEVDEAVSAYVSSHLALTNAGLWVVKDNSSYKILLASDGMKVYDSEGNLVSTFGENITFSDSVTQYIGGENAYIIFNPTNGSMTIGGTNLNISGNVDIGGQTRPLSQVLADMQSATDAQHNISNIEAIVGASTWATAHGFYKKSTDTSVDASKEYYTVSATAITNPTGCPHRGLYYEKSNNVYTLSTDDIVVSGKTYYTISATLIASPSGSPSSNGYYERDLSESIEDYLSAHIRTDANGLYVTDGSTSKVQVSSTGVSVWSDGIQVANYSSAARIGREDGFHILIGGTDNEIGFYEGANNKAAYVNSDSLYVKNSLSFGKKNEEHNSFIFYQRTNGHFTLKLV